MMEMGQARRGVVGGTCCEWMTLERRRCATRPNHVLSHTLVRVRSQKCDQVRDKTEKHGCATRCSVFPNTWEKRSTAKVRSFQHITPNLLPNFFMQNSQCVNLAITSHSILLQPFREGRAIPKCRNSKRIDHKTETINGQIRSVLSKKRKRPTKSGTSEPPCTTPPLSKILATVGCAQDARKSPALTFLIGGGHVILIV